ncbi:hypothetical protein [Argonema antarcticum]|uniref:hypothetical protein n=1 Tax=Argonema antarcticum TaxID=2942763 RepID=UPI0020116878|nr:hypothetical protein [Argonema antarcticum]MCL1474809.1 hypothetical protein [Argonema antarcticum A004/B2]
MLVYEAKLQGTETQYRVIDKMIRTCLFVRNKCLRYLMDNRGVNGIDMNKYCKVIPDNPEFSWIKKLNLMARQAMSERVWQGISKFFYNCKNKTLLPYLRCYLSASALEQRSRGAEEQRNKNVIFLNKSITTPKEPDLQHKLSFMLVSDSQAGRGEAYALENYATTNIGMLQADQTVVFAEGGEVRPQGGRKSVLSSSPMSSEAPTKASA